jgi:hypothetical protein
MRGVCRGIIVGGRWRIIVGNEGFKGLECCKVYDKITNARDCVYISSMNQHTLSITPKSQPRGEAYHEESLPLFLEMCFCQKLLPCRSNISMLTRHVLSITCFPAVALTL